MDGDRMEIDGMDGVGSVIGVSTSDRRGSTSSSLLSLLSVSASNIDRINPYSLVWQKEFSLKHLSSFNETRLEKIYLLDQKKNEYLTSSRILLSLKWGVNQHVDEYIARLAESGVTLSDEIKQLEMEVKHLNDKFLRIAAISNGLFSGASGKMEAPSLIGIPASKCKEKDVLNRMVLGSVYHHWLAIELYDFMVELTGDSALYENDNEVTSLVTQWTTIVFNEELNCTSYLSVMLDRFLFPASDATGVCLHQCTLSGQRPDFLVVGTKPQCILENFVAVSDYKPSLLNSARIETYAYSLLLSGTSRTHQQLRIAMYCTKEEVALDLQMGIPGKLLSIPIYNAKNTTEKKFAFKLLKKACTLLISTPLFSNYCVSPLKECQLPIGPLLVRGKNPGELRRVFKKGNMVYKLYNIPFEKCDEIVSLQRTSLDDVSITPLSKDKTMQLMTYIYRDGRHYTQHPMQFFSLLEKLNKVHCRDYVHSDLRTVNVIFSTQNEEAFIIDFDMAGRVGSLYPDDYITTDYERHPQAKASSPREKIHDVYSIDMMIFNSFGNIYNDASTNLCTLYENNTPEDFLSKIREYLSAVDPVDPSSR